MHVKCSSDTHLNTINFTVISVRGDGCFRAMLSCVFTSRSYSGRSVIRRFKWIWIPVFHTHFLWSEINRITWAPNSKHHSLWNLAIATQTSICGMSESLLESSESSEDFKTKRDNSLKREGIPITPLCWRPSQTPVILIVQDGLLWTKSESKRSTHLF